MPYVQRDWITNVSFFIQFLYILASCHGIKVQQGNLYSSQKRQEHIAGTLPAAYEIVEPVKVDENGAFLSHSLFHNVKSKRRKRDLNSQRVHYRILYKTEELLFNMTVHDGFLSDDYILEKRAGKLSSVKITPRSESNCHLVGTVQQQDTGSGFAAISACQGLTGFFRLSHGDYFIEPFQNSSQSAGRQQKHIIYKRESQNPRRNRRDLPMSKYQACGVNDDQSSALKQERQREKWEREYQTGRKITQRSVSKERWVETLVVADTKMIQYHGSENVESYIFTIMNMVTGLFHDASIGNAVHIKVVRLILLEEEEEGLKIVHHADQTLASFCKWQKSINPKSDAHPAHHDIAVLLTRKDICVGRNSPCETLGLSYLSGMCQPHRSCNINEDSGLPVAFTIAHEIGHSFGIHHDGQGNDCELIGQPFIMSRQLKYDTSPLTWSPCSKEDITRFLDRGWGFCLDDVPVKKDVKPPFVAPGVLYDLNHQCQLQYGPNATVCELVDNVCQTLWCLVHDSCRSKLDAAVDGTRCAENKWCFNGKCILVGRHPESIHGGWGTWSAWSHCTRTCGAGVQSAERKCNNPEPKYGGKYCTGERKRYRLCKTFPCPNTGPSFRQMQCSEFDTVPYKNELYQWIPIYNTENPCALHCRPTDANFADKLLDAVIDGTPCFDGNNSKDVCINGMCKSVGCDHEINSNATEDRCGVCLGDGSTCQTIKKGFNQSEGFGYVDVGNIPKGARDIKIEEIKAAGNFLSLRSEDPEKYYLNGGFTIQWNGDYKVAGTTFHYQRNGDLENLTASGPTNESVWIQLLFQESNPGIKYEYVIQKDQGNETESTYSWEYGRWTDCSATCGTGVQRQVAQCVNKQRGVVITTFCDQDLQPVSRQKKCHIQDCPPRWWVGEWQQCSSTCGPTGEKKRAVLCIRTVGTDEQALPSEDCHHLTKPKGYMSCNRDILCPSDWTVSNWSECSITCGGGVRTRNVTCSKNNDEPCEASKKPNSKALCGLQQCPLQKNLPPGPIKHKYGKKIIKVIPKKSGIPTKRIIFRKVIRKYHPVTKIPKSFTTSAPKMILPPVVNSIKEDFQINDIPNSTHFNVDYKYNFVLVENNKRKINSTKLVPKVSTGGEHYGETNIENKTENYFLFTTTVIPENITSANDFLTEEPETQTTSEEINVPDDETNSYGDTENSIIESRSKRHKGRANMIQYNQSTIMYHSESPTPNSNLVTTESPQTFNIKVFISLVGTEQNATLSEKNLASPAANTSEELDNLQVTIVNISEDSSKKLNNTTIGGLLNSAPHINITDLVFNVSEKVYWIIGNWSECSTTCGLGAEWRSVVCSASSEADCKHIKKPDPARKCHLRPCASWRTGNWSKCSTNCGGGFRTREVHCIDIRENRPLRPFHCQSHGPNPQQNSSCNQEPCLSWLAKPWSECSKTCGSGSRQRQVICPLENRCDLKKSPVITINCSEKPCVRWKPDAWSECSVSCGEGIQQRIVECMNVDNNSTMNNTLCEETEPKPQDTQICTNQDCKNIDPLCKKDKMSINFCKTVKSIGKCSMKNIEKECCFTCMQPETRLQGG